MRKSRNSKVKSFAIDYPDGKCHSHNLNPGHLALKFFLTLLHMLPVILEAP